MTTSPPAVHTLRAGMIGLGMIFDETYRPFFEQAHATGGLYDPRFGLCRVEFAAAASRTGSRAEAYRKASSGKVAEFRNFAGNDSVAELLKSDVDFACVATPDDRHFAAAKAVLEASCRQLAVELAPHGITTNAILAGVTDTAALRKIPGSEELIAKAIARNPSRRLTTPEDVADALVLLSGPGARWINGNVLNIDGGEDIAG